MTHPAASPAVLGCWLPPHTHPPLALSGEGWALARRTRSSCCWVRATRCSRGASTWSACSSASSAPALGLVFVVVVARRPRRCGVSSWGSSRCSSAGSRSSCLSPPMWSRSWACSRSSSSRLSFASCGCSSFVCFVCVLLFFLFWFFCFAACYKVGRRSLRM